MRRSPRPKYSVLLLACLAMYRLGCSGVSSSVGPPLTAWVSSCSPDLSISPGSFRYLDGEPHAERNVLEGWCVPCDGPGCGGRLGSPTCSAGVRVVLGFHEEVIPCHPRPSSRAAGPPRRSRPTSLPSVRASSRSAPSTSWPSLTCGNPSRSTRTSWPTSTPPGTPTSREHRCP